MNNLLQNALNFLVIPESVLSVIFLAIFFAIFVYGIWQVKSCGDTVNEFKTKAAERFEAERGHVNAANFVARFDELQKIRELKVDSLSNIFIMVGILGTFLGLGIAIHGAADLLNSDKVDLGQLNAVLSVIAFKFQTSVWGTLFSLIFMKCVSEPYYMRRQIALCETLQTISTEEVNTDAVLSGQLDALKNIEKGHASLENAQQRFAEAGEAIGKVFRESTLQQIAENAKRMEKFESLTEEARANTERTFRDFETKMNDLIDQQSEVNQSLTNAQIDRLAENEETTRQYLEDMFEKQNEMQQTLFGDATNSFQEGGKSLVTRMNDALVQQQQAMESFFGTAKVNFGKETKSVVENITEALTDQRIHIQTLVEQQNKLNSDLAAQQRALFGDAADSMEKSSQSFLSNITMQLAAQRGFMQELLQKQNEITAELNKAQKEFWGDTRDAYTKENKGFAAMMSEQTNLQKAFMEHIIEQQTSLARSINEQRLEFWEQEKGQRAEQTHQFLDLLEKELNTQRSSMEGLVAEHSRLSKVLLGDLENSTKENLIAANKGFVQHMEEYKAFSEKISSEQKRVQDALESKLTVFAKNMSEATETNNANIAEISKAMGVLHKAIENNSLILKDIIDNFYATQDNLDTVRRKEIKGLADAFTSMLKHESTSQASWRQGQESAKRAAAESGVKASKAKK